MELTTIRELYKILIEDNNGIITFTIVGNGFRRYMVRHIVGGLIQVGAKRITKKRLQELLDSKGFYYKLHSMSQL